jgi:hypothetical protein
MNEKQLSNGKVVPEYEPKDCPNFADCDAPICPLDIDIDERSYLYDPPYYEEVCRHVIDFLDDEATLNVPQFETLIEASIPVMRTKIGDYLDKLVERQQHNRKVLAERRERARQLAESKNKSIEGKTD